MCRDTFSGSARAHVCSKEQVKRHRLKPFFLHPYKFSLAARVARGSSVVASGVWPHSSPLKLTRDASLLHTRRHRLCQPAISSHVSPRRASGRAAAPKRSADQTNGALPLHQRPRRRTNWSPLRVVEANRPKQGASKAIWPCAEGTGSAYSCGGSCNCLRLPHSFARTTAGALTAAFQGGWTDRTWESFFVGQLPWLTDGCR